MLPDALLPASLNVAWLSTLAIIVVHYAFVIFDRFARGIPGPFPLPAVGNLFVQVSTYVCYH